MGKITNENHRSLENAQKYEDATLKGMMTGNEFNRALADLIDKKRIPIIKIVEKANVSKSYLNKLRNCSEKNLHPGRYVVIDIALALDATLEETNLLLKRAKYSELYARDQAESVIIWGMLRGMSGRSNIGLASA